MSKGILHAIRCRGSRHQLHQPHGALWGHRSWIPTGLLGDDRVDQLFWNLIVSGIRVGVVDHFIVASLRRQCLQPQKRRTPTIGTLQPRVASSSDRLQRHHRRWPGGVIRPDRCSRLRRHLNVVPTHFVCNDACIVHEALESPRD